MNKDAQHIFHTHHTHYDRPTLNYLCSMISVLFPPPDCCIILVGFIETNNGCRCDSHPDGCGNFLVVERFDNGVGMELRLRMKVADELACYVIKPDGTDGCCVAFAAKEYAVGENGLRLNGSIVRMVEVFLPDNLNRTVRLLYHHNCGYAVGEIVSFSNENNTN